MVHIKTPAEIDQMRPSCRLAADVLVMIEPYVKPGVTTLELNDICHQFIVAHDAYPSPLNYHGFPKSICTSVNHVVCHGIPADKRLQDGDIVNLDITTYLHGFHGDTSKTFYVGEPRVKTRKVTEVARQALDIGIAVVRPGATLGDIGHAIQSFVEGERCSVVREYCGHGIGREFHEDPQVLHYGRPGEGLVLKEGKVFTIEPMVNLGKAPVKVLGDGWTVVTRDKSLSAQFEHTLAVTAGGCEILTLPSGPAAA
ncbi:MAG TPA: type I methionyl aminopeptidase [Mariprofundaceae bacterium]|nr:type I methionyl aminopeptidase [Mariprofundaceae bacterium]